MASLSKRTTAQTEKRAQVEAAVLRATEELLSEGRSFGDLRVEEIATRAGISRTAFYFYFRDKRELLLRLTEDVAAALYRQAEGWWGGEGDPVENLRASLRQVIGLYGTHGALLRAVVEASTYDEPVAQFWRALVGRFVEATRRRIEAEQEAGAAPPMPAEATAFALTWMTERAMYQQNVQERTDDDALLEAIAGIWLRAVYGRGE